MKADRFFVVNIVDKFSRMFMLVFAGMVLGAVLALAYYNIFRPEIGSTLTLISVYCVIFICYVYVANSKRKITKVEIFKDHLSFIFAKKNEISTRQDINYSDIKSYKISSLTDKKNYNSANPDKDKYSLRVFGFETTIETNDGSILNFSDNSRDGVLIYSPTYIYRMLDVKRFVPNFPLELVNFDSKKDVENFKYQFDYYSLGGETLSVFKNKKYLICLFKYTLAFALIAVIVAGIIGYTLYIGLKNPGSFYMLIYATIKILLSIVIPMWIIAVLTSVIGAKLNRHAKNTIQSIITE